MTRDPSFFLTTYAPTTTHMGFLEMPAAELAEAFYLWQKEIYSLPGYGDPVKKVRVDSDFATKLQRLLPLVSVRSNKTLISETRSNWCTFIPNKHKGGYVHGPTSYLAETLRVRRLSLVLQQDVRGGRPGSIQFGLMDYRHETPVIRTVSAHKESRWEFEEHGERLWFEEVEQYSEKRIKDRLTAEMVERYCQHLGIELFDPDFYEGDAWIIQTYSPPNQECFPNFPNQPAR